MAKALEARGFDTDVRIDDAATRAGIISAYEQLIEADATASGGANGEVIRQTFAERGIDENLDLAFREMGFTYCE